MVNFGFHYKFLVFNNTTLTDDKLDVRNGLVYRENGFTIGDWKRWKRRRRWVSKASARKLPKAEGHMFIPLYFWYRCRSPGLVSPDCTSIS